MSATLTTNEVTAGSPQSTSRSRALLRGPEADPRWVRPALIGLLAAAAVLYLWNLSASGNANTFYAAAVEAGSKSWKAWFFGSLDSSNFITVDKPPAALWVMGLSARIFGFSSWSLLVPQAIEGVLAVALLFATVRRVAGPRAGLLAGAALALTPAAVLIFRFDNPDALLVLLLVAAAYCVTRALERASTRWLLAAGAAVGFGFLTKSGQALLIVPGLGLAYLVAAPTTLWRRIGQLTAALAAVVVAAGWWLLAVALWPAADRPYIGGSTNNNPLELAFGYNGLGRLFGGSGNGGGGGGNTSFGGATGLARLFRGEFGLEASWLLPAALVAIVGIAWARCHAPRTDRVRAALILWAGWLLVTAATFSYMKGTIHPYYTVALAPAIAALVGIGGQQLWAYRRPVGRALVGLMVGVSAVWGVELLHTNEASPGTVIATIVLAVVALGALLVVIGHDSRSRRALVGAALVSVLAVAVPVSAWGLDTAASVHTGSIPTAVSNGTTGFGGGGMGSAESASSAALTKALKETTSRWSVAVVGSQSAASLELSSGTAVMAIGGWSGSDPSPTLAEFKAYVAAGDIQYFIVSGGGMGGGGAPGGSSTTGSSAITSWVEAHFTKTTIGGQTVYDLTKATS
jgi:4-amino-4-deoxy-L-arabinose transferase-like glycosyltransferase